jgi:hypothetical protein
MFLTHLNLGCDQLIGYFAFRSAIKNSPVFAATKRSTPLAIRLASVNRPLSELGCAQRSRLRSPRVHAGSLRARSHSGSLVLSFTQAIKGSRGMRTERPRRTDGISPWFARSRTFARLIDNSFAASGALSSNGKSRGADEGAVVLPLDSSVKESISWWSVATTSSLTRAVEAGEPGGPGSPTPPPGRWRISKWRP